MRLMARSISQLGHSRPGRTGSKSGHVRYAAESGSRQSGSVPALTSGMPDDGNGVEAPLPTLRDRARHRIDQQAREQQQPGVAVGLEDPQAQRGIADVQSPDLPDEMRGEGDQ